MQAGDDGLDVLNGLALCFCQSSDVSFLSGNELVQRRIQEADGYGVTLHCFVDTLKVSLLHGLEFCQSSFTLFDGVGADHLTEHGDTILVEEHMLGTGQADAVCAKLKSFCSVCGSIGIGTYVEVAILVSPSHDAAEFTGDGSIDSGDHAFVDVTGGTVNGDEVAFFDGLAGQFELLVLFIHLDIAAAGDTAGAHAAGNDCCVAGHTAANGQDALCSLHAFDIFGAGLETDQNDFLAALVPLFGIFSTEDSLAACSAGRSTEALAHRGSGFQCSSVELRVKQSVEVAGIDHGNCFLLIDHAFVDQVTGDLQSSLSGTLAVAALQHVELAVLHGELHVLHVAVMIFQKVADLDEFRVCFGELLFHLSDGHRGADTGDDVFALSIGKELAHEFLLAGGGITGECNTGTGVVIEVAEDHRHNVDGGTPGVRDIVVTTVNIGAGVVPGAENCLDGELQLFHGIGGEVSADLLFVLGLELFCQFLQVRCSQLDVVGDALLLFHLVDELFKILLADFHDNVREHLDETTVGVIYKALEFRIGVACDHCGDDVVVQTEVQDGVHHAGHGSAGTGTDGNQQRVLQIAELLAVDLFHLADELHDLCHDIVIDLAAILIVLSAGLGSDRKALRDRKANVAHLSEVSTFTAEQLTHRCVAFGEQINKFFTHAKVPFSIEFRSASPLETRSRFLLDKNNSNNSLRVISIVLISPLIRVS